MKRILLFSFISLLLFPSCIKEEVLDREADIISFVFADSILINSVVNNESVNIVVRSKTDLTSLVPDIKITSTATIYPPSGESRDFSSGEVEYTVYAENPDFSKKYKIIVERSVIKDTVKYDFEEWIEEVNSNTYIYPALADNLWSSANLGIAIVKGNIESFPTRPTTDAYKGKYAAMLETQKGATYIGKLIPIFSGSLFRGNFRLNSTDFPKSAKFGQIHDEELGKPVLFKGYYKYTPGEVFYDEKDNVVPGRIDECSIYSILYKVTKGSEGLKEFLDGTNVMDSDKIIARAEITDRSAKAKYTEFSLPFIYYEEPDYEKYDYKLAVVFASSLEGDLYRGAVGSTLIVDEVELIFETPADE